MSSTESSLRSLAVQASHISAPRVSRDGSQGIGTRLLDALEPALLADGTRLYERRGFRPTWMYLARFSGR
jgi:hypothetical protein